MSEAEPFLCEKHLILGRRSRIMILNPHKRHPRCFLIDKQERRVSYRGLIHETLRKIHTKCLSTYKRGNLQKYSELQASAGGQTFQALLLICYNIISVILSARCVSVPPVFGDIFIKRGLTLTSALYLPGQHNEVLEQSVSLSVRNFWQFETFTHTSFSSPASFTSLTDRIVSIWGGWWKRKEGCELVSL